MSQPAGHRPHRAEHGSDTAKWVYADPTGDQAVRNLLAQMGNDFIVATPSGTELFRISRAQLDELIGGCRFIKSRSGKTLRAAPMAPRKSPDRKVQLPTGRDQNQATKQRNR